MYAFSLTPTNCSFNEDEKNKLDNLTDTEKEAILDDMYGRRNNSTSASPTDGSDRGVSATNNNINDSSAGYNTMSPETLRRIHDALESAPPEKSGLFWHAWTSYPRLVDAESDFTVFLRHEKDDYNKAVTRLCEYWDMRFQLFGEENAFQPMTLQGAMKDVVRFIILAPNFCRILPDDDHGRTVVCVDKTDFSWKEFDDIVIVKILWFVMHETLRRRSAQENGVVFLSVNKSSSWDFPSIALIKKVSKLFTSCFPLKVCCVHRCCPSLAVTILHPMIDFFVPHETRLRFQIHSSMKESVMLENMEKFGLRRNNLPHSVGGQYNKEAPWINECEQILKKESLRKRRRKDRENRCY